MNRKSLLESYEDLKDRRRRSSDAETLEQELVSIASDSGRVEFQQDARLQTSNAARLVDVYVLAQRVFGDPDKAQVWLARPNTSLGGQAPISLLKDELGAAVVRETLEQIDHGIFA